MPILLIEDEPRILAFLRRGLEAQGYAVDWAADGVEGLRRIRAHRYDLVVLDLLLPKLDGFAVLRELRSSAPGLPVLILSARSDLQTKLRGFELGRRLGLPLRPRLQRRRGLRAPAPEEARRPLHRDRPPCRLSRRGLSCSTSRGGRSRS